MGTVDVFDHTADLGLRIRGADLPDLFATAAEGLSDTIVANRSAVRPELATTVELAADDPAELLALWLNELIYRGEVDHRFFARFDVAIAPDGRSLVATAWGEPIDPERHVLDHEVKAVTRHGLTLEASDGGWLAEVILDI